MGPLSLRICFVDTSEKVILIVHTTPDVELLSFDDWSKHMTSTCPQFHYWHNVLQLELLFLQFLIPQRESLICTLNH